MFYFLLGYSLLTILIVSSEQWSNWAIHIYVSIQHFRMFTEQSIFQFFLFYWKTLYILHLRFHILFLRRNEMPWHILPRLWHLGKVTVFRDNPLRSKTDVLLTEKIKYQGDIWTNLIIWGKREKKFRVKWNVGDCTDSW